MNFGPVKHVKEVITWQHVHFVEILVHWLLLIERKSLMWLQTVRIWTFTPVGIITLDQKFTFELVRSHIKLFLSISKSQWTKISTKCICGHVITSFRFIYWTKNHTPSVAYMWLKYMLHTTCVVLWNTVQFSRNKGGEGSEHFHLFIIWLFFLR